MHIYNPPQWLKEKQSEASARAKALGLPRRSDEGWRHSSLRDFLAKKFSPADVQNEELTITTPATQWIADADQILVFFNGVFVRKLSTTVLQDDFVVMPLARVLMSSGRTQERVRQILERTPNPNLKGLAWTNLAQFQQGAFVKVGAQSAQKKLAILHLYGQSFSPARAEALAVFPRNIYCFEPGSTTDLLELHLVEGENALQVNNATDWVLEEGAKVVTAQAFCGGEKSYVFSDSQICLRRNSQLQHLSVVRGGEFVRNELEIRLEGEGADAKAFALNIGQRSEHMDLSTAIFHQSAQTSSEQIVKSVLAENAQSVFSGRLVIDKDAQKSNAKQHCYNLLLSDSAEANARPQLEVKADDVKAAHGATVGQIRGEELFYLRSRGLSLETATRMIADGFQSELIERIESRFLQESVKRTLERKA